MIPDSLLGLVSVEADGCWRYVGKPTTSGYARFRRGGRPVAAHRWVYATLVGEIPEDHDIDHVCHNADASCTGGTACLHRVCLRPDHLAPATRSANVKAGVAGRTSCPHGSDRVRSCQKCTNQRVRAFRARQEEAA